MEKCKLCKEETKSIYNINLKAVSICEDCGRSIFIQQAVWYTQQEYIPIGTQKLKDIREKVENVNKCKLIKWAKDGCPPIDLNEQVFSVGGLIEFANEITKIVK